MSEREAYIMANSLDREMHRRKLELILLYFLGAIVAACLVVLIYFLNHEPAQNDTLRSWSTTTMTAIIGFITGFVSARRNTEINAPTETDKVDTTTHVNDPSKPDNGGDQDPLNPPAKMETPPETQGDPSTTNTPLPESESKDEQPGSDDINNDEAGC